MKCYFDGSEGQDPNDSTWLTLAACAAPDSFWGPFNRKWEQMLRERYPIPPFIHMWQIASGEDPFCRRGGEWTDERIDQLVMDAVKVLQEQDKSRFRSFVCSIDVTARDRLIAEGLPVYDAVSLCTEMCFGQAYNWHISSHHPRLELSYLFFDRGEDYIKELKARWLAERTPPGKISTGGTRLAWDMISDIQELDMKRHPPIQAADMFAWSRSRSLLSDKKWVHLATIMQAVVPSSVAIIDEEKMRIAAAKKLAAKFE
jgi:hypothetical protein